MKKEPISNKRVETLDDIAQDAGLAADVSAFDVDPKLKTLLSSKNLVARWISASVFKKNNGYNANGWIPLRDSHLSEYDYQTTGGIYGGFNSEGFFVRGDLLLAIRSKEKHKAHQVKNKAAAHRAKNKIHDDADALARTAAREGGHIVAKISEEY